MIQNRLAIDTQEFAEMITYSNSYKVGGYDGLNKAIITNSIKLSYLKSSLLNMFSNSFVKDHEEMYSVAKSSNSAQSNYVMIDLLHKYKEYSDNTCFQYNDILKRLQSVIDRYEGKPKDTMTELKVKMYQSKLNDLQSDYNKILSHANDLANTTNNYDSILKSISAGGLFLDSVNKKIELVILPTTFDEILGQSSSKNNESIQKFSNMEIFYLTKYCTLISTHSESVCREMQDIIKSLNNEDILLRPTINNYSLYSKTAEAIVSGVNFLVPSKEAYNTLKYNLNHICEKKYPNTKCASPYMLEDYAKGNVKNEAESVNGYKVIDSNVFNYYFGKTNNVVTKDYK